MSTDLKVKGRRSIHRDDSEISRDTTAAIHGSQEHLSEETSYEADDSLLSNSASYDDTERKKENNSANFSPVLRRKARRRSVPTTVRTKSPIRLKSPRNDSRNVRTKDAAKTSSAFYLCLIIVLIVVLFFLWSMIDGKKEGKLIKHCTYSELRTKYPGETDYLWKNLKSGIEDMLNDRSDSPAVYLFVHSGKEISIQLIRDIANASSSCFDSSMKPLEIDSSDFTSEDAIDDYGYVIEKYKEKMREGNVILIANLNEIPPKAARALHPICDTISPIVRRVMIFLSLVADHREGKVIDTAVDSLMELWEENIESNELDALITRVTDQVILLQSN